ncbi:MAG: type II toxin-antitoxin system death-on-curing family toxin [Pseudomonadota bacterium]
MTLYLTVDEILELQEAQIKVFGGAGGVRDIGLIEVAALRPQVGYYSDLLEEAAALWESLAMNHGFVDSNKRISYISMEIFLEINGIAVTPDDHTIIRFIHTALEGGTFTKDVLHDWMKSNTGPFQPD